MGDLFSSFNPSTTIMIEFAGNWFSSLSVILIIPQIYWVIKRKIIKFFQIILLNLLKELNAVLGNFSSPGIILYFSSLIIFIISINFIGLFPYVFTSTRHLRCSLSLALPLWIGYILLSLYSQLEQNLAHLVPEGTPGGLIPLIVIIETIRLIIRPGTLAVRLAANIVAGHLLLALLGGQGAGLGGVILICLIVGLILLIVLECAVACIQAYVFTILRTLYINEHRSKKIFSY